MSEEFKLLLKESSIKLLKVIGYVLLSYLVSVEVQEILTTFLKVYISDVAVLAMVNGLLAAATKMIKTILTEQSVWSKIL